MTPAVTSRLRVTGRPAASMVAMVEANWAEAFIWCSRFSGERFSLPAARNIRPRSLRRSSSLTMQNARIMSTNTHQ